MKGSEVNANPSYKSSVPDLSSYHNHFIRPQAVMEVEGFSSAKGEVPLINPAGITAAINRDSTSDFIYEIAISKSEFLGADFAIKDVSVGDITLSVKINTVPHSASNSKSQESHRNGSPQQMGTGHKQFNGGGYNRGSDGIRQMSEEDKVSLNKKSSFKQKFVLAKEDH